jgi:hypothetical protein
MPHRPVLRPSTPPEAMGERYCRSYSAAEELFAELTAFQMASVTTLGLNSSEFNSDALMEVGVSTSLGVAETLALCSDRPLPDLWKCTPSSCCS